MKKQKFINVKYTEIIDLQTVAGKTSVIGIHQPIGVNPIRRMKGLYANFRRFRYNGARLTMVPAQNLPVDPLGLTGIVGSTDLMDPRDALNPILTHGCHGEHLGRILDSIYSSDVTYFGTSGSNSVPSSPSGYENSDSANKIEIDNATDSALSRYYQCLTDQAWKKHGIQAPLRWNLRPLVNRLVSTNPIVPHQDFNVDGQFVPGFTESEPDPSPAAYEVQGGSSGVYSYPVNVITHQNEYPLLDGTPTDTDYYGINPQIFTTGLTRLGWMPTTRLSNTSEVRAVSLPKAFMGVMILPPSYNVEQFFRLSLVHSFTFADFTTSGALDEIGTSPVTSTTNSYFNWVDYDETSKETDSSFRSVTSMDLIDASAETIADGVR